MYLARVNTMSSSVGCEVTGLQKENLVLIVGLVITGTGTDLRGRVMVLEVPVRQ